MADGSRQGAGGIHRAGVWWAVGALVALAVVAWGGWLLARPPGEARVASADRPTGLATSSEPPSATGAATSGTRGPSGDTTGGTTGGPTSASHDGSAGAQPGAPGQPQVTPRAASAGEGPQDDEDTQPAEPARLPGLSPAPRVSRWLVARPLPANAQARGQVVAGYPRTVLPTPRWARVRSSSVSSDGTTMQATLQAHTGRSGRALLEHYRSALIARGFGVSETPALGSQQALRFFRRADSVVVTVDPGHASYSVYAVLHAAPRR